VSLGCSREKVSPAGKVFDCGLGLPSLAEVMVSGVAENEGRSVVATVTLIRPLIGVGSSHFWQAPDPAVFGILHPQFFELHSLPYISGIK
jgi:hypothetical protein